MKLREYNEADLKRLKEMYDLQGFDYAFPDMNMFMEHLVVEHDGEVKVSVAAKSTADIWLFIDPNWETPGIRLATIEKLHGPMKQRLINRGVKEVHAWPPPSILKSLSRRLKPFGWERTQWTALAKEL